MTFTHALGTNNYGPAKFIVSTSAANGTHTTLAAALAAASSGDTVFLRDSVTENVTIPAGVNITCWEGGSLNTPSITGKITMTVAGTCTISGLRLITNSDNTVVVSGSNASILNILNCYLSCTNNTGISFTASNTSAQVNIEYCTGDLGTTGVSFLVSSSTGAVRFLYNEFTNTGASTSPITCSAGSISMRYTKTRSPVSSTSTGVLVNSFCYFECAALNTTAGTFNGTGGNNDQHMCKYSSGTASAITVGSGATTTMEFCAITSSNTNAVTGLGTLNYTSLTFDNGTAGANSTINTTTQQSITSTNGIARSSLQPCLSYSLTSNATSATGDGTSFTPVTFTKIFDQANNFNNTTGTFTAPVTGRYLINCQYNISGLTASFTLFAAKVITTARQYVIIDINPGAVRDSGNFFQCIGSCIADMTAGDTATMTFTVSGSTKTITVGSGSLFQATLLC